MIDEERSLFDLSGRSIVITGGGGHLGRAMSLEVAKHGGTAVICGRNRLALDLVVSESKTLSLRGLVVAYECDVGVREQLESLLDFTESRFDQIHGWVNNAYSGTAEKWGEMTASGIQSTLSSGLFGPALASQWVASRMQRHEFGSIVNVASMYGLVSPQPAVYEEHGEFHNPPAYGAAKSALLQLTRYMACHLAEHKIRVNSLTPGAFPGEQAQQNEAFIGQLVRRIPMSRVGKPRELGGAVVFLLSDASSYMTGANLVIDGGWTAW